jgi:isopenicillin N synthase-like dioxygenase
MITPENVLDLQRRSYTEIPFRQEFLKKKVVEGWLSFLREPQDYKNQWTFIDRFFDIRDRRWHTEADTGYIDRRIENGKDPKEFFHYRANLKNLLLNRNVYIGCYKNWLDSCEEYFNLCFEVAYNTAKRLGLSLGQDWAHLFRDPTAVGLATLRLLYYHRTSFEPGEILAKFHTDQSAITVHCGDSGPGLILGTEKDGTAFRPKEDKALVFLGHKAGILSDKLKPLPHGVKIPEENVEYENRWTVVAFFHPYLDTPPD